MNHFIRFLILFFAIGILSISTTPAPAKSSPMIVESRRINVPYWQTGRPEPSRSIAWFGKVDLTSNYVDLRTLYREDDVWITAHIMDRLLRYDETPGPNDITNWDAISIYIDLDGNSGNTPDGNSYRFDLQLNGYHLSYRWSGTDWLEDTSNIPFSIISGWRGDGGMNDTYWDKGWVGDFMIPFSSLGLLGSPSNDVIWGFGVVVYDRDENGVIIPNQIWPETFNPGSPASWGQLNFGIPVYKTPLSLPKNQYTIREGLDGAHVVDGDVGGQFTCGDPYGPSYYPGWGGANYSSDEQINIQNQWDIADWPCFSKFFITFPIDKVPPGETILSATLSMTLFGNSGGGEWGTPPDSYIQVLSVNQDWNEATLNWNNAPLAFENISGTWVKPKYDFSKPDRTFYWDVSRAFLQAYQGNKPLRLALYSADGPMHTGKYFWSSNVGDWNAAGRPTLHIQTGVPCNTPGINCKFQYLPISLK